MMEMKMYFSKLPDSRDNRGLKHELVNIVVMSIYAVLCGYTDAENMAFFMKLQEEYFTKLLDLKHGVPSADTLLRVFAIIEPESFMQMFYCWIRDVLSVLQKNSDSEVQRIAIDGKAIHAAAEKGGHIPYIISAYLGNYGLSIGQLKVGEKTNEIKEIPKLLKNLDITDCVITIDAIGCQKQIAKQIVEQKGHYCLAVKTNQAILYQEIKDYFSYAEKEEPEQIPENAICETEPCIIHRITPEEVTARVDTGAKYCSLHVDKLSVEENVVMFTRGDITYKVPVSKMVKIRHASIGDSVRRPVIKLDVSVRGLRANQVEFTLNDRSNMKYEVLIGRNALEAFGLPVIITKNPEADVTRDESEIYTVEEE